MIMCAAEGKYTREPARQSLRTGLMVWNGEESPGSTGQGAR